MDALREVLNPWLGEPRYEQSEGRVTLSYRFASEDSPPLPLRLKLEINTREHFAISGFRTIPFEISSRYFTSACEITTYAFNELLGTKLRALYQRRKGRDLFDLAVALDHPDARPGEIVKTFQAYMEHGGHKVSRAGFEENLAAKLTDRDFIADIGPLLSSEYRWNLDGAADAVREKLIRQLT